MHKCEIEASVILAEGPIINNMTPKLKEKKLNRLNIYHTFFESLRLIVLVSVGAVIAAERTVFETV